jgi:hypothetical protein
VQTDAFVIDSTGARVQAFQTATNVSGNAAVTTNGMLCRSTALPILEIVILEYFIYSFICVFFFSRFSLAP